MLVPFTWARPRISAPFSFAEPDVIRPGGMGIRPIMLCTVTDLPQPDSPTIASVFPRLHVETDAAHRLYDTAVGVELDLEIGDFQQCGQVAPRMEQMLQSTLPASIRRSVAPGSEFVYGASLSAHQPRHPAVREGVG